MNILICGKNTLYLKSLAERLKREKNEIHYISGSKAAEKVGRAVFQQFDFEYTNPNIVRIVKSAMPEVMILLGATDRNFTWRNPEDDAMTFVSGMSSLMMAAKGAGVRKIIFISSITVFENNRGKISISEVLSPLPFAIRSNLRSNRRMCIPDKGDKIYIPFPNLSSPAKNFPCILIWYKWIAGHRY